MFVLYMIISAALTSAPPDKLLHPIGTFEHYGQCLQAEAAMSEAIEADERQTETRAFYRCFPVPEQKELSHGPSDLR